MATMTFQDGVCFGFKIQLENDIGELQVLFHKMISFTYLKKIWTLIGSICHPGTSV
jgi:hypothetical protein